jgi:hypothetical protein
MKWRLTLKTEHGGYRERISDNLERLYFEAGRAMPTCEASDFPKVWTDSTWVLFCPIKGTGIDLFNVEGHIVVAEF